MWMRLVAHRSSLQGGADIELQFCLDRDTDFHNTAKDLVDQCNTTYITGLCLQAFKAAVDRETLRDALVKAAGMYKGWSKSSLHPALLKCYDMALRYGVAV